MQTAAVTKERILNAAEHLFAERGFDGASVRAITREAEVNLASVNYHFSSKESLVRAVIARRIGTINRRRLELLNRLEAAANGRPIPVEDLVRAFVDPVVRLGELPGEHAEVKVLLARLYSEPSPAFLSALAAEFREFAARFGAAFSRSLPDMPPEVVHWRIVFMVGALTFSVAAAPLIRLVTGGLCDPSDVQTTVRQLTYFLSAAFPAGTTQVRRKTRDSRRPARSARRRN